MDIAQRIQAKTDNGDTIIDFLIGVMRSEFDDFKLCHRLDAARLLTKYGCSCKSALAERDQAIDFIVDNPSESSRSRTDSDSSRDTLFDDALAKKIRESTDDGATVCRFLINVMEGHLKAFTPQNRISAARELLSRGFGKHATPRRSGEGRNPEKAGKDGSHPSTSSTQSTKSSKSPNHTNQSNVTPNSDTGSDNSTPTEDDGGLAAFMEEVTPLLDEDDRIKAELAEKDPDNQPYKRDLSAYHQAWDNSEKWFYEWKNSLDPEEYEAIAAREIAEFNTNRAASGVGG